MLIFVDCEANGPCPSMGTLTEIGACTLDGRTFYAEVVPFDWPGVSAQPIPRRALEHSDLVTVFTAFRLWLANLNAPDRPVMISDNPAYDWQWINDGFHRAIGMNPFGHSARRIGDYYAGLIKDHKDTSGWKSLRKTPHDHNPLNDALGNAEAFRRLILTEDW